MNSSRRESSNLWHHCQTNVFILHESILHYGIPNVYTHIYIHAPPPSLLILMFFQILFKKRILKQNTFFDLLPVKPLSLCSSFSWPPNLQTSKKHTVYSIWTTIWLPYLSAEIVFIPWRVVTAYVTHLEQNKLNSYPYPASEEELLFSMASWTSFPLLIISLPLVSFLLCLFPGLLLPPT